MYFKGSENAQNWNEKKRIIFNIKNHFLGDKRCMLFHFMYLKNCKLQYCEAFDEQKIGITAYTQDYKISFASRMEIYVSKYTSICNNHPELKTIYILSIFNF